MFASIRLADIVDRVVEDQKEKGEIHIEEDQDVLSAVAAAQAPAASPARRGSLGGLGGGASGATGVPVPQASPTAPTGAVTRSIRPNRHAYSAVRLDNNELRTVAGLPDILREVVEDVEQVSWLDLSFNRLQTITGHLDGLPNLQMLYLHGNDIKDWRDVRYLRKFPKLKTLTLHGTPLSEKSNFRAIVLSQLPHLRKLDSVTVTPRERDEVEHWSQMLHPLGRKHDEDASPVAAAGGGGTGKAGTA